MIEGEKQRVIYEMCKRQINLLYKTNKKMTDSCGNRKTRKYWMLLLYISLTMKNLIGREHSINSQ